MTYSFQIPVRPVVPPPHTHSLKPGGGRKKLKNRTHRSTGQLIENKQNDPENRARSVASLWLLKHDLRESLIHPRKTVQPLVTPVTHEPWNKEEADATGGFPVYIPLSPHRTLTLLGVTNGGQVKLFTNSETPRNQRRTTPLKGNATRPSLTFTLNRNKIRPAQSSTARKEGLPCSS